MRGAKFVTFFFFKKIKEKCENSEKIKLLLDEVEYFFQKTGSGTVEIRNF